jgi:branched-chain amino acid aminotransferase
MQATDYIWQDGEFKKWQEATVHVLSHTLHYGGGAFEGIRVYKTKQGSSIFKLDEHVDRLLYSAKSIGMEMKYSHQELCDIILELLDKNKMSEGYIRPLFYYGYHDLNVNPTECPVMLAVACWPWGQYLAHDCVDVMTSKYTRIHPKSTIVDAKLCGHYLNSQLASLELEGTKYHEVLLLDADGFVAEGAGENIFIVKDKQLYTPKLGNILAGITRNAVIDMARHFGYSVEEKTLRLNDIYTADESFFTGTAAEVTAIRSLDDNIIADGNMGPVTTFIKSKYDQLVRNELEVP